MRNVLLLKNCEMLSRKKKNIVKLEARPEPPLPLPVPVQSKDRSRAGLKNVKTETVDTKILLHGLGNRSIQQSQTPLQPSTNSTLKGMISNLGEILKSPEEEGVAILNAAEKQREIKRLLHCLNDWDSINDQTLLKLISELKGNIDTLDENQNSVIQQVLSGNWHSRSGKVVTAMEQFLSEMLVVRAGFVGVALQALISKFNPLSFCPGTRYVEIDEVSLTEQKVFSVVHRNLRRVFQMFPMKQETGVKIMASLYPFMGKDPHVHFCFVTNLLQSIEYMSSVKSQILHLIIHKLARIDVNVSREDIEQAATYNSSLSTPVSIKAEGGGHEVFSMELENVENFTPNPLINVVDVCLHLVLEYISTEFKSVKSVENLFDSTISAFESEVIPTFSLNNVQFVYFYLASLDPAYATTILELLWKKAICVNTPAVIRIQVMAYMSGYLSRASFISIKTVKRWLTRLADWANAYVDKKGSSCHWSNLNVDAHGPFYAVCQTIFYVFAFRNKELLGTKKCVGYTRTLNLGRLVTSDLNPLKACAKEVAESFVSAAYVHQISYCRTVLERNQLATIPTTARESLSNLGSDSSVGPNEQLESFFPFDQFLLPRSRVWIDPIHSIYEPYIEELKTEKENPHSENEDSIEMELGTSYSGSLNSSLDFFCNGTTPFKFKTDVKYEGYDEMDGFID